MIVFFGKNLRIVILLSTITLITANKAHPPPKSVNVALETSFLFDPKDLHQNKHFVNNIRKFLGKLLEVIDPQKPPSRLRAHNKRRDTKKELDERTDSIEKTESGTSIINVLDFVKNIGQNFVNLSGNKIAEAVSNMHVEVITEPSKHKGPTAIPEEVIDPQKPPSRLRAHNKRRDTKKEPEEGTDSTEKTKTGTSLINVLDFVKNVSQNFVNLSGNKIAEAVSNMNVVITKQNKSKYKRSTAKSKEAELDKHDIKGFKRIISDTITNWMRRYPEEIRTIMNKTINGTNPLLDTFATRMNNYYNADDIKKLKKLLKKFKRSFENHQDTSTIVNELLDHVVFKKYGSLNDSTKSALIEDLKMCSEMLLSNDVFKDLNNHFRRSLPNHKIETGEMRNIDDITYTNLKRSIDNKLRDTREKNEENQKKKSNTNEIVVDSAEFLAKQQF